jgi:hypothetical protein
VNSHSVAELIENAFGAIAAGFAFVGVAALDTHGRAITDPEAAAANPFVALAQMNMIEFGQS